VAPRLLLRQVGTTTPGAKPSRFALRAKRFID
jgi:hypothetical protein